MLENTNVGHITILNTRNQLITSLDSTLCKGQGLVTAKHFLGSCKLRRLIFFLGKPIRLQLYDFHVILHLVVKHCCTRSAVLCFTDQSEYSSMILHLVV